MKDTPAVSVVMPVYNVEHFLSAAIESILAQSFADFELIIIDDGSIDGSLDIARSYVDPRIRVLAAPHRGLVSVRNRGLTEARGEYMACMDADDLSEPQRLLKQVACMEAMSSVVMLASSARLIDEQGRSLNKCVVPPTTDRQMRVTLCASNPIVNGSTMMRTRAVRAVGGYRPGFPTAEDYDLWFRLGEVGDLAGIPEPLYQLRVHKSSTTASLGSRGVAAHASLARHYALQRYLRGTDQFGYTKPRLSREAPRLRQDGRIEVEDVNLSEWALACLLHHEFLTGQYLLLCALLAHPLDSRVWSVVRQCYISKATARVLVGGAHRTIRACLTQAGIARSSHGGKAR